MSISNIGSKVVSVLWYVYQVCWCIYTLSVFCVHCLLFEVQYRLFCVKHICFSSQLLMGICSMSNVVRGSARYMSHMSSLGLTIYSAFQEQDVKNLLYENHVPTCSPRWMVNVFWHKQGQQLWICLETLGFDGSYQIYVGWGSVPPWLWNGMPHCFQFKVTSFISLLPNFKWKNFPERS